MSVTITLTFETLAEAIAALAPAYKVTPTEVHLIGTANVKEPAAGNAKPADKPATDKPKAQPQDSKAQESKPAANAADTGSADKKDGASAGGEPLAYEVLQKAVFALAGKSREAAAEVNASFGVKTMKELPAERRHEALAAVNAKLAGLEVA